MHVQVRGSYTSQVHVSSRRMTRVCMIPNSIRNSDGNSHHTVELRTDLHGSFLYINPAPRDCNITFFTVQTLFTLDTPGHHTNDRIILVSELGYGCPKKLMSEDSTSTEISIPESHSTTVSTDSPQQENRPPLRDITQQPQRRCIPGCSRPNCRGTCNPRRIPGPLPR